MPGQVEGSDIPAHGRSLSQVPEAILHDTQHCIIEASSPAGPTRPAVAEGRSIF